MKSAIKPNMSSRPSGCGDLVRYAAAGLIGLSSLLLPWQPALALQKQELLEAISSPAPRTFTRATRGNSQQPPTQKSMSARPIEIQSSETQPLAARQQKPEPILAEQHQSVLTIRNQRYLLELVECDFNATNQAPVMIRLYARQAPGRRGAELWINRDGASYQLLFASDKPRISYQAQQINLKFADGWLQWHGLAEGRDGPLPMQLRLQCGRSSL